MGLEHVRAGGMYLNGEPGTLIFEEFPYRGTVTTYSADYAITDSGASATAMATGQKVNNRTISMAFPGDGSELTTILEYNSSWGRSTGLVTTTVMTHATPAAFGAHEQYRSNLDEIALDYFTQTRPTLLLGGGGWEYGMSPGLARANGYTVVTSKEELQALTPALDLRVSGQFGDGDMPYVDSLPPEMPTLREMTAVALDILEKNSAGFFLMVEGGRIDHASHVKDIDKMVKELIAFNAAVSYAYEWAQARTDTLVIVTADHETGGLTVLNNNGKGNLPDVVWEAPGHTSQNVGIYAFGAPVEIEGVIDNTDIFSILRPGEMSINRTVLNFGYAVGGSLPSPQSIAVSKEGIGALSWTAISDSGWINVEPPSGTGTGAIAVSVEFGGLAPGNYTGIVTVTDSEAPRSVRDVTVNLAVKDYSLDQPPMGAFDSPVNGSIVSSSIPVTGWALDDVGLQSVKIYREAVAGEGNNLVYIGEPYFVEGARPDVETAYPGYPNNYKAGWGYMLLTNFLPDGNGTFTLHAVAGDVNGNTVTLGTTTITVDNINAVNPFGAIDTPAMGQTVSGGDSRNLGWVLTPQPNTVPVDGSTIKVFIDGIEVGQATYNIFREDIAVLFPGYSNSDGALAYFDFHTGSLRNGIHTIAWGVTDSAGNSDGIGSRYFSVLNTNRTASAYRASLNTPPALVEPLPIKYRTGIEEGSEVHWAYPNDQGIVRIRIKELERLVITLSSPGAAFTGYMVVGNQRRPLPIGSTLEKKTGTFYWMPGPGFTGEYRLVFNASHTIRSVVQRAVVDIEIEPDS